MKKKNSLKDGKISWHVSIWQRGLSSTEQRSSVFSTLIGSQSWNFDKIPSFEPQWPKRSSIGASTVTKDCLYDFIMNKKDPVAKVLVWIIFLIIKVVSCLTTTVGSNSSHKVHTWFILRSDKEISILVLFWVIHC